MPDFQIARLPDFRDISGTEADARVRTAAGVVAVEGEHTSVRTVGPAAPAIHAALGYAVIPPHVVALVYVSSDVGVREKGESAQHNLGSVSDRAVSSSLIKGAASAFIFCVGDRSRVRPLVAHIVQFYGFTGNMGGAVGRLALRIYKGAVCGVDGLPACARCVLRVVRIGCVVVARI